MATDADADADADAMQAAVESDLDPMQAAGGAGTVDPVQGDAKGCDRPIVVAARVRT